MPGFHYPSSRAEFSGAFFDTRVDGCQKMLRVDGPSTRAVNSGVKKCTRVQLGPWTRAVISGSGNRA